MEGRLKFYTTLYKEVLKLYSDVNDHAMFLKRHLKYKRSSNCKILSDKIIKFKIREVIKVLLEDLREYERFFNFTYKGFYCSLCDAKSHRFIDLIEKKIIYGKSFC